MSVPLSSRTSHTPLSMALLIRAEFGGMDHDRDFLRRLSVRAAAGDLPVDTREPTWIEHDIDGLVPTEHILLEAIDQHCCSQVLREPALKGVDPQAIWWCRSSLSVRPIVGWGATEATAIGAAKRAEHTANLEAHRAALDAFSRRQIARGWILSSSPTAPKHGTLDGWLTSSPKFVAIKSAIV